MKRSGLKRKSKKRKAVDIKRREFVSEQLSARPWCEAGAIIGPHLQDGEGRWAKCEGYSSQLHEPLTRARAPGPETILDPENSVAICFSCHRWTHDHVGEATEIGLLIHSWDRR